MADDKKAFVVIDTNNPKIEVHDMSGCHGLVFNKERNAWESYDLCHIQKHCSSVLDDKARRVIYEDDVPVKSFIIPKDAGFEEHDG